MNMVLKEQLLELAEPQYQEFTSKLLPGTTGIMGVRLPKLRKMAKQIVKEDWRMYLREASNDSFEEIMLQGIVIGYTKANIKEILEYIEAFVPQIDNWSVCDTFCSGLKISKQHPREVWNFLQPYLKDTREFYIRFGVVMCLQYYISEEYMDEVFQAFNHIKSDAYYVKMAIAWAVSMYYVKLPARTMIFLENNTLDDFTFHKTLQKITESLRINKETKSVIRSMKRK